MGFNACSLGTPLDSPLDSLFAHHSTHRSLTIRLTDSPSPSLLMPRDTTHRQRSKRAHDTAEERIPLGTPTSVHHYPAQGSFLVPYTRNKQSGGKGQSAATSTDNAVSC